MCVSSVSKNAFRVSGLLSNENLLSCAFEFTWPRPNSNCIKFEYVNRMVEAFSNAEPNAETFLNGLPISRGFDLCQWLKQRYGTGHMNGTNNVYVWNAILVKGRRFCTKLFLMWLINLSGGIFGHKNQRTIQWSYVHLVQRKWFISSSGKYDNQKCFQEN